VYIYIYIYIYIYTHTHIYGRLGKLYFWYWMIISNVLLVLA